MKMNKMYHKFEETLLVTKEYHYLEHYLYLLHCAFAQFLP